MPKASDNFRVARIVRLLLDTKFRIQHCVQEKTLQQENLATAEIPFEYLLIFTVYNFGPFAGDFLPSKLQTVPRMQKLILANDASREWYAIYGKIFER